MEIRQAIIENAKILKENNITDAYNIARILMAHTINKNKEYLIINDKEILADEILQLYNTNIEKVKNGYPLQYITNSQEFMKLNFYVDDNVLIPQPDTEILVEEIIRICKTEYKGKRIKLLDLCTGSGAIAICIKKYVGNVEIIATDISYNALEVAKKNTRLNNVEIKFIESNMFENINDRYDIIVSNPPYIETETLKTLSKDVQCEPILALDGGIDGLSFYREISKNSYEYLKKDGYLVLEIGYNQKNNVIDILEKENKYKDIKCIKDLENNDRVIISKLI
mgnify:CR=1 FL=1